MAESFLKNIYLFKDLSASELKSIEAIANEKTYAAGQDIFFTGDKAESMFVIKIGTVSVRSNDNKIATIATGSHFGEMPFLDGEKRSASVVAEEQTVLYEISYDKLKSLMEADQKMAAKVFRSMAVFLCGRLRGALTDLNFAREHAFKHF